MRVGRPPGEIRRGGPVTQVQDGARIYASKEVAMGERVEPDAGARGVCDDGVIRTWSQMTAGLAPEDYPASEAMCRDLLWAFGAVAVS